MRSRLRALQGDAIACANDRDTGGSLVRLCRTTPNGKREEVSNAWVMLSHQKMGNRKRERVETETYEP